MTRFSLGTVLKAALIAGLVAGLSVSLFHLLVTEPVIDQAIAIEEHRHSGEDGAQDEPIVSRRVQKGGLIVGFLFYGVIWSTLLGITWYTLQRWLPGRDAKRQRMLLALAAYWAVALFPFLKYPANPPGVGDPETIGYRQLMYLAAMGLAIAGAALALILAQHPNDARTPSRVRGWVPALALLAGYSALVYAMLPPNADPIDMPASIVDTFRSLSVAGLTLFWVILAGLFAMLLKDDNGRAAAITTA